MNEKLTTRIEALCQDIENQHFKSFPRLKDYKATYKAGRKFCKIIIETNQTSVWGFVNLTHEKFNEGDILLAQGWAGPAMNRARGNLLTSNYKVDSRNQYGPGYVSGYSAGGDRDGSFV